MTPFLLRNYQAVIGGILVAVLLIILAIRTDQRNDARGERDLVKAEYARFRSDARAEAESMARRFTDNARRIETEQAAISQESSREYQSRIAELRARVDRLRSSQGGTNPRSPDQLAMPGTAATTGGSATAAPDHGLSREQRIVATEQAIQLDELIKWVQREQAVSR